MFDEHGDCQFVFEFESPMPSAVRRKPRRFVRTTLNISAFALTFVALTGFNLPDLRAVTSDVMTMRASAHDAAVAFAIPQVTARRDPNFDMPPVPQAFSTEEVTLAAFTTSPVSTSEADQSDSEVPALPFGLFGSLEFATNSKKGVQAWHKALYHLENERPLYAFCDSGALRCPPKYLAWRALLQSVRDLTGREQLARLNRGINKLIRYRSDRDIFSVRDHWASPMEFLQTGGDCEDFTILKYASLLELGYSDDELRIAVVRDVERNLDHAVLAVATGDEVVVLDSLQDRPVAHHRVQHYQPVYSLNRKGRWVHVATRQISRLYAENTSKRRKTIKVSFN
jgi:predicted transglutaminase-like cysteine proteinase